MSEVFYKGSMHSHPRDFDDRERSVRDPGERPYRDGEYDYIPDYPPQDTRSAYTLYNGNPRGKSEDKRTSAEDDRAVSTDGSMDSTGKQKSFVRLISRFAEKTSMQGVPYINNAKFWWAKAMWTFLLLAAVAAMVLHLWFLITQYLGYPIVTKVSLSFSNLAFPSVTICNTNIMHKGRFDQFRDAPELKSLVRALNPRNLVPDQFDPNYDPTKPPAGQQPPPQTGRRKKRFVQKYDGVNKTQFRPEYKDFDDQEEFNPDEYDAPKSSTFELQELFTEMYMDLHNDDRMELGHQISDMLLDCSFGGRECNSSLFKLHQTATFGNCWTLESDKFTVQDAGPDGALSLTLYLESTEYLQGITNGYGIRLQVHPPDTVPFPESEGQFVPASMETSIALKFVSISRKSKPYGNCEGGNLFWTKYRRVFTRRACRALCQVDYMVAECGCFPDVLEAVAMIRRSNKTRPCRSDKEKNCQSRVERLFNRKQITCVCDNPCKEVKYEKSSSNRQWPTEDYAMVLLEGVCEEDTAVCKTMRGDTIDTDVIRNNFLKLNIYYEELNFENYEEVPEIEDSQFASDVGGAIGLWIGLSMLSMCEVFQLILELFDYTFHKVCKRNKKKKRKGKKNARNADPDGHKDNNIDMYSERERGKQWPNTQFGVSDSRVENSYEKYPKQSSRYS